MWPTIISLCLALSGKPPRKTASRRRPAFRRPLLEVLEDRTLPSAYVVTTTADSGPGSLRDALTQIDADTNHTLYPSPGNPAVDEIDFAITAASDTGGGYNATTGVATIVPQSGLPPITNAVLIDGYTQPGATPNTLLGPTPLGSTDSVLHPEKYGDNAVLKIELGGGSGIGLEANNITVQGLVINRSPSPAIFVSGANDVIRGNFLGTDVTGTQALGNAGADINTSFDTAQLRIGGTDPADRNIISGALNNYPVDPARSGGYGIYLYGPSTGQYVVQGNLIGTDVTGRVSLGNANDGIGVDGSGALIGGSVAGAGNVISGNSPGDGAQVGGGNGYVFEGNFIGTDVTGTKILPTNPGTTPFGIGGGSAGGMIIGAVGAGNLISGNASAGLFLAGNGNQVQGNYIGTDVSGTVALGNSEGVRVFGSGNTIGGTTAGAGNVISGNGFDDINIGNQYTPSSGNVIEGNKIGTDVTGTIGLGNGHGVELGVGAINNTIGGMTAAAGNIISGTGGHGVYIADFDSSRTNPLVPTGNVVEGNFIGTDKTGTVAVGNQYSGIYIQNADGNTIGGTAAGAGNIIAHNGFSYVGGAGITLDAASNNNTVIGNSITGNADDGVVVGGPGNTIGGTTAGAGNIISANGSDGGIVVGGQDTTIAGNTIFQNAHEGIRVQGSNNTIGGTAAGAGNVIYENGHTGVYIDSLDPSNPATGNVVQGNYVGTDMTGTTALGNTLYGIALGDASTTTLSSNFIAYNGLAGVYVFGSPNNTISGNTITANGGAGVNVAHGFGDSILGNSISANGQLGIALATGANHNQAAPVLTVLSSPSGVTVSGSVPNATTTYLVQLFANASPDPSGAGQGQILLGSFPTDTGGNFTASLAGLPAGERFVSATATVQNSDGTFGDTSQFAQDVPVPTGSAGGPYVISEGNSLTLDGSGSSDPAGGSLTYSWTINGQANAASGVSPTLTWSQLEALGINDGPATFNVQVQVTNAQGGNAISPVTTLTVNDVPVSNLALSLVSSSINEGGSASLSGSFTNPSGADANTVVINWGDGSANSTVNLAAGVTSFSGITHQYLDNPAGQPNGSYPISVTVSDGEGAQASAGTSIQVNNVAPSNVALTLSSASINEGSSVTLGGTFTDPGILDTHQVVVNWGDGSANTTVGLAAGVLSFSGVSHQYLDNPPGQPNGSYPISVTVTDKDGGQGTGTASVQVNNVAPSLGTAVFGPTKSYGTFTSGAPSQVAAGDFTGNGILDLAVPNYNGFGVDVLLGKGDGSFQDFPAGGGPVGRYPTGVAVGDFNGDGKLDLVVTNTGSGNVSILMGNGDGTFAPAVNYLAGSQPVAVTVGDFDGRQYANGQPILDLAVANNDFTNSGVTVLRNNGDGTFTMVLHAPNASPAIPTYTFGSGISSIAAADLNGDGNPDLVATDPNSGRVAVLLGLGDGTFRPPVMYASAPAGLSVAVGDFDGRQYGNGRPILDLAVAAYNTNNAVTVLLNNGDVNGTFGTPVNYPAGPLVWAVAVGAFDGRKDANGQPILDLAVLNNGSSGSVSVLLGNGEGTFQAPQTFATDTGPSAAVVGDFNRYGATDLVTANSVGTVSVLLSEGGLLHLSAASISEGQSVTLGANFTDPGTLDTHTVVINWGDGSANTTLNLAAGMTTFSGITHQYLDNPAGQPNGSYTITVTVTDKDGASASASTSVQVNSVAPTAGLSGPSLGVPGQPRTFTISATTPSPTDQAAGFQYAINWGDGTPVQTITATAGNGSGVAVDHVYTTPGTYTVTVTAADDDATSPAVSQAVTVQTVEMEGATLAVGGTTGNDTITLSPADSSGDITVNVNGTTTFNGVSLFKPTDHILVYGQTGNDTITLASAKIKGTVYYITVPAILYGGGTGKDVDTLNAGGSTANNVLLGGAGKSNTLTGGLGRDLLIAGLAASKPFAGSGGDILIGGSTDYDLSSTAMTYDKKLAGLEAIMAEWGSADSYATRVNDLLNGGGLNGSSLLNTSTVHENGQADTLFGITSTVPIDWFLAGSTDVVKSKNTGETQTLIS